MEDLIKAIQDLGQYTYWDYILFGVNVISVIVSVIALVFAIRLPIKIAKSQNDVALFEKRCECYVAVQTLLVCAAQLEDAVKNMAVTQAFKVHIMAPEDIDNPKAGIIIAKMQQMQGVIISGEFLFSHYDSKLLQQILSTGMSLISKTSDYPMPTLTEKTQKLKEKYCALCKQFEDTYLGAMEKELQLSKKTR